jgi:hypothetical protein
MTPDISLVELQIPPLAVTRIEESPHQKLLSALGRHGGPTESHVSKLLQALLRSADRWLQGPVSPWQFAPGLSRQSVMHYLQTDRHIWQPDIDLISGPMPSSERHGPMHAIELKHFALVSDRGNLIPKTRQKQGFYAGLDEALALTLTGVDCVSLWQVFQLPWGHWQVLEDDASEQAISDYIEYSAAYMGKVGGLIKALSLPLGYQCAGLLVDRADDGSVREVHLVPAPDCSVPPSANPIRYNDDPVKARRRLVRLLNVIDP